MAPRSWRHQVPTLPSVLTEHSSLLRQVFSGEQNDPHQGIWTCKCLNPGVQVTYKKRTISGNVLNSPQWVRADVRCSPPSPTSSWPRPLIHILDTGLWTVTWHFGKLLMHNAREESLVSTLTHSTSTFMNDFDFIVSVSHVFLPENGHEQNLLEMH